jgi:putative SOS response-associated peptidase YedK
MCGRYMITSPFEAMIALFEAEPGALGPEGPRPNVSPTQTVPAVVATEEGRMIVPMRWGFLPHWYKTPQAASVVAALGARGF